jgi:hypothetical protein
MQEFFSLFLKNFSLFSFSPKRRLKTVPKRCKKSKNRLLMREILSGTRSFTYNEVFRKGEREEIDGQNEYINYIGSNRIYYLRRIHRG